MINENRNEINNSNIHNAAQFGSVSGDVNIWNQSSNNGNYLRAYHMTVKLLRDFVHLVVGPNREILTGVDHIDFAQLHRMRRELELFGQDFRSFAPDPIFELYNQAYAAVGNLLELEPLFSGSPDYRRNIVVPTVTTLTLGIGQIAEKLANSAEGSAG
ncbi:hypothetical protein [Kitasatospora sp. NPDC050463]|uniref:hypothetical protein n=1 Tax=Kitasatospora sp. NPDC050463 TaxID=3155786 RepID=UPI0033D6BCB8